jgi:hypothetical protein
MGCIFQVAGRVGATACWQAHLAGLAYHIQLESQHLQELALAHSVPTHKETICVNFAHNSYAIA